MSRRKLVGEEDKDDIRFVPSNMKRERATLLPLYAVSLLTEAAHTDPWIEWGMSMERKTRLAEAIKQVRRMYPNRFR